MAVWPITWCFLFLFFFRFNSTHSTLSVCLCLYSLLIHLSKSEWAFICWNVNARTAWHARVWCIFHLLFFIFKTFQFRVDENWECVGEAWSLFVEVCAVRRPRFLEKHKKYHSRSNRDDDHGSCVFIFNDSLHSVWFHPIVFSNQFLRCAVCHRILTEYSFQQCQRVLVLELENWKINREQTTDGKRIERWRRVRELYNAFVYAGIVYVVRRRRETQWCDVLHIKRRNEFLLVCFARGCCYCYYYEQELRSEKICEK